MASALPTDEAIYPGETSQIKFLHLDIPNPSDPKKIVDVYGPILTEENPEDYAADPHAFAESDNAQYYSLREYLKLFEDRAEPLVAQAVAS